MPNIIEARQRDVTRPTTVTARDVQRTVLRGNGRGRQLVLSSLLLMSHQTGEALVPVTVGVVIDRAVDTSDGSALVRWLIVLAAVFVMLSFSYRFGARRGYAAMLHAAHDLRVAIAARSLDARGSSAGDALAGSTLSLATSDAARASELCFLVARTCAVFAALGVGAISLVRVSIPLTLLVMFGLPPVIVIMRVLGGPLERRSSAEQAEVARASGLATDIVSGLRVLKGIGAEDAAAERYRSASRSSLAAALRAAHVRAWYDSTAVLVPGVFLAIVALVAGRLALSGTISVGQLIAVLGLAQFLQGPFNGLSFVAGQVSRVRASTRRIADYLSAAPAIDGQPRVAPPRDGGLRLIGVTTGRPPVLDRLDLDVHAGECVGVVVDDPAGAAAMLALISRHRDPDEGRVELGGVDVRAIDPEALRRTVVVALHDAAVFEGSVLANAGALTTDTAAVSSAVTAATVDEIAETLPDGLDTSVGERGGALSGGQRQRVALARALAAESPVLVLHDPTSAIDTVTESLIAERMRELRAGRTTVVFTSSPTLLAVCDRVVVVEGGRVAAEGAHHSLVDDDPRYRELVLS
jgi:putative ABC transport system ATP-binding protein